jgi:F-type H+-transporting ATPase subunit delta
MSPAAARSEAKRLLALSLHEGTVAPDRVAAVLDALAKRHPSHRLRPILRAYLGAVRREVARGEARIEHAGPLSPEAAAAIADHFSKALGRPVKPVAARHDALLAGFRVRVGDDVTDLSAAGRLERLARALA